MVEEGFVFVGSKRFAMPKMRLLSLIVWVLGLAFCTVLLII
jgi:hypothetical protein